MKTPNTTKQKKSVELVVSKIEKFVKITDNEGFIKADELRIKIKNRIAEYETSRKEKTAPINEGLRKINEDFKRITEPLKEAQKRIENAMLEYRQKEEEKRIEAEKLLVEETGNELYSVVPSVPEIIETKLGRTSFTKSWTFEVVDLSKVSRKYLMIDEDKVKEAIASGEREINGLKIYEKEGFRTTKK
jgi:hypothetical protein